ncbi:hypothetical protein F5Y12DRAFT_733418, partial [Xylaria sp. FL1777]
MVAIQFFRALLFSFFLSIDATKLTYETTTLSQTRKLGYEQIHDFSLYAIIISLMVQTLQLIYQKDVFFFFFQ